MAATAAQSTARETRIGVALVAGSAAIWGTIGVAVDLLYGVAATNVFSVAFLRLLIAAPALLVLSRVLAGKDFLALQRRHLLPLGLIGVAFAGYQLCYFSAIPRLGVAAAVLINICSAPIFVALLARVVLQEQLTLRSALAMLGAIIGTILLVGGVPQSESQATLLSGALLALGAGFSYAIVVLCARIVAPHYHPVQPIAVAFTLAGLLLAPTTVFAGLVLDYPWQGWALLIYLGLVPTALAYALYLRGARSLSATAAAILTLLEPLGSTLLAVLLLGERLAALGLVGAVLLIGSLLLLI